MTTHELAEFLALVDKLGVETHPNLTREEKELWKLLIDDIKKNALSEKNMQIKF